MMMGELWWDGRGVNQPEQIMMLRHHLKSRQILSANSKHDTHCWSVQPGYSFIYCGHRMPFIPLLRLPGRSCQCTDPNMCFFSCSYRITANLCRKWMCCINKMCYFLLDNIICQPVSTAKSTRSACNGLRFDTLYSSSIRQGSVNVISGNSFCKSACLACAT